MKYLKYVFSSMLIAGALVLAGCGSKGSTTRDDGGRSGNVVKELTLDREISLQGVVRGYRTGAPLDNILVTLIQGGKVVEAKTVGLKGHYAFLKVPVYSDQSAVAAALNAANSIQLEFSEIKTKKLDGNGNLVDGSTLYPNGTATPSYPESRLEFTLLTSDLTDPGLVAADAAATIQAGNLTTTGVGAVTLADAINEGRSYYFVDANTVYIRDTRLVQTGVLTGTVADSKTGLPVANALITIDTDPLFNPSPVAVAGDIIAVWQQTRITTTSGVLGTYTFASVPALDYGNIAGEWLDIEATGYLQNSWIAGATASATTGTITNDHANIQDDLVGSLGVRLLVPITYQDVDFTMKIVDKNFAPLSGVAVKFTYDTAGTSNGTSAYGQALANGLVSETIWTFTSNVNGVVTGSVPQIDFRGAARDQNLLVTKNGYFLQGGLPNAGTPNFSSWNNDNSLVDLDVNFLAANTTLVTINERNTFDFGVIQMIPQEIQYGEQFTIQLVYNGVPLQGVTARGFARWLDTYSGIAANDTTTLIAGDAASDANGFITFTNSIPVGLYAAGGETLVLEFNTTAATNGNTGASLAGLNLQITQVGNALGDMDSGVTVWNTTAATADGRMEIDSTRMTAGGVTLLGESGSTIAVQFFGTDKYVGTLQGFLVEGTRAKTAGIVAGQIVGLSVTPLGKLAKTYFSTTDATGKYIFTSAVAPAVPVVGTAYNVKIPVATNGALNTGINRLLKLKLMDTSKVFSVWITNPGVTTVTDAGLAADGTEIWLNSSTNIATRNGVDQISTGTNTWLEQLNGDNAGTSALVAGYAEQTLTVHTAQIQDVTALPNGYHVVTLVDGSDAKPVIYTSNLNVGNATYAQRTVYTFATSGNSDSIKIIMSGAVDYTKTWIHTGGAQATSENKITINATGAVADAYVAANTDGNDATTLGTEFVYDTTLAVLSGDVTAAVGRSIVIRPAGNATKFELGVIYRMFVSVYDANGNKSDDTIEFRFFDKPSYFQSVPTLAVHQMIIQNDTDPAHNRSIGWANSNAVAADLASYSIAWNDKNLNDVVNAREVNVLLSNVGANVATAAMGSNQSTSIKLSRITLRFPAPTKADGSAFTTAELVALDALNEYRVFAQAYKASDKRIIRSWTNVTTDLVAGGTIDGDDTLGSSFSAQTAGFWTISCDLDSVVDAGILTYAEALASGNSVDLVVVHKSSQIDATKVLTLNGTRSGVQPSALLNGVGNETHVDNISFGVSSDVIVSLNEAVNSTDTSVPTMTVTDTRLTLVSPRYINDQQIQGQLTWTAPAARTALTTQALTAIANVVVPANGGIIVGNDVYVANGSLTAANNQLYARNTSINNKLANVATFTNNVTVNQFQSYTNAAIPVINDQTVVAFTNAGGAQTSMAQSVADNSTATAIDIDWAGIADAAGATTTYTVTTAAIPANNIWNNNTSSIKYANVNDNLKALLNTLPIGYRLYLANGTSLTLLANVPNTSWTIGAVNGNATAGTGDTTDARNTFGVNTAAATTTLFNLVVFGRLETAGGLVAADATNAGTIQDSVTRNNAFGLRSAIAFTAVPVSTTEFTYTEVGGQRLRVGDTLRISQKQSAIGNVWNHGTALVTGVLTNGTANLVSIGAITGIDGTTATTFVFTQGVAVTDIHIIFYGDQVTVGLGGSTGLKTAIAGNTASTLVVGSISFPSQLAVNSNPFKDASTNSLTSTYVMAAGGLPTPAVLTFAAGIYDIFVR